MKIGVDYLYCDIYKHKGHDCSNGGLSSKYDDVILFNENKNFEDIVAFCSMNSINIEKACIVVSRIIGTEVYKHIVPILENNDKKWTMFGGSYISTSDSRFRSIINTNKTFLKHNIPVSLHDRVENW